MARGNLVELEIGPGILTEETARGAFGRYKDGDKIRFRQLLPEKLGGWVIAPIGTAPGNVDNANSQFTGLSASYIIGASSIPLEGTFSVLDGDPIWLFGTSLTGVWGTRTINDVAAVTGSFIFDLDAAVTASLGDACVIEYPAEFGGAGDADFASVALLADQDGPNGATVYTEVSNNAFSANFVGSAQLDTSQKKFGSASCFFLAAGSYQEYPDDPAFALGSGDFTIEGWAWFNSFPAVGDEMTLVSQWSIGTSSDRSFAVSVIQDGGAIRFRGEATSVFEQGSLPAGSTNVGQWYHFVMQASAGGVLSLWFDGLLEFEAAVIFGPMNDSTETVKLGVYDPGGGANAGWFDGFLDDVRITVGVARYPTGGNITPPTAAFPTSGGAGGASIIGGGTVGSEVLVLDQPINTYLTAQTIVRIDLDGGGVHWSKTTTNIVGGTSTIQIQDGLPAIPALGNNINLYCATSDIVDDVNELSYVVRFLSAPIAAAVTVRLTESLPCDADGNNVNIFPFQQVTANGDQAATGSLAITPVTTIANADGSAFAESIVVAPKFETEQTCFLGFARALHDWVDLDGERWLAIGTDVKLYLVNQGTLFDITPLRQTGILTDPFDTVLGDQTVTVNDVAHGGAVGNFVRFSGASIVGGLDLNDEFQIGAVIDANSYTIEAAFPATATASGGGTVLFEYDIDVGAAGNVTVQGWGTGPYGAGLYGFGSTVTGIAVALRIWSLDNFGEDLLAAPSAGALFHWDLSLGTTSRAVLVEEAPATIQWMLVSPEARHVIAFGAGTGNAVAPGEPDKLLIRWSSSENFQDWVPTSINTAGDLRLDKGSAIVTAVESRGDIIIMTDESLHAMQFIGGGLVFSLRHLGQSVAIIGPNAGVDVNGIVFFMGEDDFLIYDGVLRVLDCDVRNEVFDDINGPQGFKVFASVNKLFTEVWWLYPDANSETNTRYVKFNYKDLVWDFGTIERTAFHDSSAFLLAPYATQGGKLFLHETGVDDSDEDGVLHAMNSFVESYDAEIEPGGQHIMHISSMIPDFKNLVGSIDLILTGRQYPQDPTDEVTKGPFTILPTTNRIDMRMRARQISYRIESNALGDDWRMGTWRANVRPHGRRGGG